MERIELELINEICENQNFDELLLKIVHKSNSKNRINNLLNEIENNKTITRQLKMKLYEEIFEYVSDVNDYLKNNLKEIFLIASEKIIAEINNNLGGNVDMLEKIRVIIAEDNIHICKFIEENLKKHNDIEILGIANTDEEEIKMIEEQKPEIVITDLMRNNKYSGLDIIKNYYNNNSQVEFLVISADYKEDVINDGLEVAGYIKKPFKDYEIIYNELKRIKKNIIISKQHQEWREKYYNLEIININKYLTQTDKKLLEKLGIKIKDKIYTEFECECLYMDFLKYYDDPENDLSEDERKYQKSLDGTGVTREEYNEVLKKIEKINNNF
ncbi:response regulator receiver protein [Clostridium sp. CAG:343]|nr:response regulator receiver protein [Clostridium sp. CAG:343]HCF34664.1 response regulator [Clostridiales bacterium]